MPLVRADGLSTQHMRSLTYALTAPDLDGMTSLQVTGSEWVAHVAEHPQAGRRAAPGSQRRLSPQPQHLPRDGLQPTSAR